MPRPTYIRYNYCSTCKKWFRKPRATCPECGNRLRTRPKCSRSRQSYYERVEVPVIDIPDLPEP